MFPWMLDIDRIKPLFYKIYIFMWYLSFPLYIAIRFKFWFYLLLFIQKKLFCNKFI